MKFRLLITFTLVAAAVFAVAVISDGSDADATITWDDAQKSLTVSGGAMADYTSNANLATQYPEMQKLIIQSDVTRIGQYAFKDAGSLTYIEFNATGCEDLTSDTHAFCCAGAASGIAVKIGNSVTALPKHLFDENLLSDIANIKTIDFGTGLTAINSSFAGCPVEMLTIPGNVQSIENHAFEQCASLTTVVIQPGVLTIGDDAFDSCHALTTVTFPDTLTSIGEEAFAYTDALTAVSIPSSVTNIGHCAFMDSGLTSATIRCAKVEYGMFQNCGSLATVDIDGVTSVEQWAFSSSGITDIAIPSSVTKLDTQCFKDCRNALTITVPASVTDVGAFVFDGCTAVTTINFACNNGDWTESMFGDVGKNGAGVSLIIADGVTKAPSIGGENGAKIVSLTIGKDVTVLPAMTHTKTLTTVDYRATSANDLYAGTGYFQDTGKLKVTFAANVKRIPANLFSYYEFSDRPDIVSVSFPSGLEAIGNDAFKGYTFQDVNRNPISDVSDIAGHRFEGSDGKLRMLPDIGGDSDKKIDVPVASAIAVIAVLGIIIVALGIRRH